MEKQPNKELFERLKSGDLKAFEEIFKSSGKAIYGYVFSFVGQREAAEDLTQEVFIKVFRNASNIDPEKGFKAWLYKIATNTIYDWLRQKQKNTELFIVNDGDSGFETIDEDSSYITLEDNRDLASALQNIKQIYRNILHLYYFEGFTYEEVAETLQIPLNTAKTHIRRAKEALKKELTK